MIYVQEIYTRHCDSFFFICKFDIASELEVRLQFNCDKLKPTDQSILANRTKVYYVIFEKYGTNLLFKDVDLQMFTAKRGHEKQSGEKPKYLLRDAQILFQWTELLTMFFKLPSLCATCVS